MRARDLSDEEWDLNFEAWAAEEGVTDLFAEGVNDRFNEAFDSGWRAGAAVKPRVDKVTGEYFRKGKCAACGKGGVERTKAFSGATLEECNEAAETWARQPLRHKRCE